MKHIDWFCCCEACLGHEVHVVHGCLIWFLMCASSYYLNTTCSRFASSRYPRVHILQFPRHMSGAQDCTLYTKCILNTFDMSRSHDTCTVRDRMALFRKESVLSDISRLSLTYSANKCRDHDWMLETAGAPNLECSDRF